LKLAEFDLGSCASTWIKVDPGLTSLGSSKLLTNQISINEK